jgi:hypothetical protein
MAVTFLDSALCFAWRLRMVEAKQHSQPQWRFLVWQRRPWVALATLFILVWWLVPPLLYRHTGTANDAKLKAITDTRTALLAGLIGVGALLTFSLNRRTLEVTEQGQVTDRYTRAVEQLGHEKAPVRLGALYSLERLAQDNPEHRQTVIDVFCAYLRMHYTLPADSEPGTDQVEEAATAEDGISAGHSVSGQNPTQEELQVARLPSVSSPPTSTSLRGP